ncbi:NB-ARC - like 10, partial [Theobroma cacao]
LQETLSTINAVLRDAEEKQESNHALDNWIIRLQDVVFDAEDLLDEFDYAILRRKVRPRGQVYKFFSSSNPLVFRLKMGHRFKEIRERLDAVAADIFKFNLSRRVVVLDSQAKKIDRETASKVRSELIIGREKEKEQIIESLLKEQNHGDSISNIVAIVGFGGLGKTSLARLVYNDARVTNFSKRIWVCVSEEFNIYIIFKKILKSLVDDKVDDLDLDKVQRKLEENLEGERYLLVLDDVWNEDASKWNDFLQYLVFGAPGSKILVTTRSKTVASTMGVQLPYLLKGLNDNQSWALFEQVAFLGQRQIDPKLREIGKDVAQRCKGVPLAIKCLGGLMRQKPNEKYWLSVKENEMWKLLKEDDGVFPVLRLSYIHLPNHLKQCFAFCSIFPKDCRISKDMLIHLWRAQGYIQWMENERIQDIGDEYFNDLFSRSFFQEEKRDETGNIVSCKMHDLIHDLALLVAKCSFYLLKVEKEKIPKGVRSLSLSRLDALEYVADSFSLPCSTSREPFFPSLKKLLIHDCPNLKGWWKTKNENQRSIAELPCFPCLSELDILSTINAILRDAEEKQESNHAVDNWIIRLQDVVFDAEDLLDEFDYAILRRKVRPRGQVYKFFSSSNPLVFRLKMGHRFKEIRERLDAVAADIFKFNLSRRVVVLDSQAKKIDRETASKVRSELIIGREKEKEQIIESLLKEQNHGDSISNIVAIVGFGGLGKTSLARLVYNDARVTNFSKRIWVCVSEEFNIYIIFKKILKSLVDDKVDDLDLDKVQRKLEENLEGERYLLVLDDVWNEDASKWNDFLQYLVFGAPGSKILVTTRSKTVASTMGVQLPYLLKGLNDNQSWALFEQVAFLGQRQIDPKLREIGKDVAQRCKGVPLAIKCLGGLMRQKPNEKYWLSVKENEMWKLLKEDDGVFPVLRLSYIHLPNHLKQCFAFCSIFPKDCRISKDMLIHLWRAQGYIQWMENERIQDIGDEYFNDLFSRSFFQEEKRDETGNIVSCKMHDLIHDLALLVAKCSFYLLKVEKEKIPKGVRHVSLECKPSEMFLTRLSKAKGIRTMYFREYTLQDLFIRNTIFSRFNYL